MPPVRTLPYLTPKRERLSTTPWMYSDRDTEAEFPAIYDSWDPTVPIKAFTDVTIDVQGVLADCGLAQDAILRIGAGWKCEGTRLLGKGTTFDLAGTTQTVSHRLALDIPGRLLRSRVELNVQLILLWPPTVRLQRLAPTLPGSILLHDSVTIQLEGIGPRFPTEVIDFASTHFATGAGWALYWRPEDLTESFDGGVRLYINSQHTNVLRAVSGNRPEDHPIRDAIKFDVAGQLVYGVLGSEDFVQDPKGFEAGSVGATVRNLLSILFPGDTVPQLAEQARRPSTFSAKLQERLRIFMEDQP